MSYGELSVPIIMPINIVKVYKILQGKATIIMANEFGRIVKNVGQGFFDRTLARLKGAGVTPLDSQIGGQRSMAKWSGRNDIRDWRVKLTIPSGASALRKAILDNNDLLAPLVDTGGIFWPLTPAVVIQHSANYNPLAQTHSNYPFQAYQNSQVDSMNIIGEFPVQNQQDAAHWVATVNFLRTVTKMFFGKEQDLKGNPPPILHMSGYGDHMFQKVPVIINTFNVELRPGIDYISTKQNTVYRGQLASVGSTGRELGATQQFNPNSIDQTWAPTLSNISVLVTPIYSRESIKNFSLSDFARGKLNGKGTDEIGFI